MFIITPEVDIKVQEAFSSTTSYQESIYLYELKAVVETKAQTSQGETYISIDFAWEKVVGC